MGDADTLVEQALRTYERLTRRLEKALEEQAKFPARGRRTTAYSALLGRIKRLHKLQAGARARYVRRQQQGSAKQNHEEMP